MKIIVAADDQGNIGKDGKLPWPNVPEDMAHFKKQTMGKAVIMGRVTWESIPEKFRPLPGRRNIVVSRTMPVPREPVDWLVVRSLQEAYRVAGFDCYLIGGGQLFTEAFEREMVTGIDLTVHHGDFGGDVKFHVPNEGFKLVREERGNVLSRFYYAYD